jgi:hypothetical protein
VIDLRSVNALTIATIWPMPDLKNVITQLKQARFYFKIDLFKGFWLVSLPRIAPPNFSPEWLSSLEIFH